MAKVREPVWISRAFLDAVHLEQLHEHGGLAGIRDDNALESALARAQNRWHYSGGITDVAELGAAYGWAIVNSHPYRDGNKRAGFMAMATFVELNGFELQATDEEVVTVIVSVADHGTTEAELATWLRSHLVRIT